MLLQLIWYAFLLATIVQLFYWLIIFSKLAFYQLPKENPKSDYKSVSVVICTRNEAANIQKNLIRILDQNYPSFEVLVINDNSTDNTLDILLDIQKKYSILRIIDLEYNTPPGKKAALSRGIESAEFDTILLTDADCVPSSTNWILSMQKALHQEASIILGYSPYERQPGFLNRFIRFEAIYTAIQYLSFALIGHPYMGVGRNLAYRKELFRAAGGFQSHSDLASGDDDLLINAIANKTNTTINIKPEAFIYSSPKESWRGYYRQKSRHLTTGTRYQRKHQLMLGVLSASHFGHYVLGCVLMFFPVFQWWVLGSYVARMGVVWWLSARILRVLKDTALVPWIPVLDIAFQLYYLAFAPILLIGKKDQWK